jgi:undecaprenyl-diphosphatase
MTLLSFIQSIENIDVKILLAVNGANNSFMDTVMYAISDKLIWIPLYLLLLYFTWKHYKLKGLWVIVAFALAVTTADQISVHLFKNVFQRYRPCHNLDLQDFIHLVKGKCGGKYGFISSHACNTAAVATVGIFFFRKHVKWLVWLLITYALLNSYSRVYLGVHYPSDVVAGAIVGVMCGLFAVWLINLISGLFRHGRIDR